MGSFRNRRGGVRDAPPEVYLPFFSARGEDDSAIWTWLGTFVMVMLGLGFVLGLVAIFLEKVGLVKLD